MVVKNHGVLVERPDAALRWLVFGTKLHVAVIGVL